MAHQLSGNISMSFCGAVRRVKAALQKPPLSDFLGKQHPQHQALTMLEAMPSNDGASPVPYRRLDSNVLLPIDGSWALFQLFEAIQLRAAWLREETHGLEAHDVAETFGNVGHTNQTPFFPEGNVTPMLRRALLQLPSFKTKIGSATYLEQGAEEEGVMAKLTARGIDPIRISIEWHPGIVRFNNDLDIWELTS